MDAPAKRFVKGLFGQALRVWGQRHRTIILTYHRVIERRDRTLDYSQPGMVVTAPTFERQLAFLTEHFDIVPLASLLVGGDTNRPGSRPRCVITFDDGWRDNYHLAFPILRQHGLSATIFLATDFVGTDRAFWHTELIYLFTCTALPRFLKDEITLRAYPDRVRQALTRLARLGESPCARDLDPLIETVKAVYDEDTIEELVHTLMQAVGLQRPLPGERRDFIDWDHVREMAAAGIEIGSHGCSHRILTMVPIETANEEFVR